MDTYPVYSTAATKLKKETAYLHTAPSRAVWWAVALESLATTVMEVPLNLDMSQAGFNSTLELNKE